MKKHSKRKPTIKEYTMHFTEKEKNMLAAALILARSTMLKDLLIGFDKESRSHYADMAHGFHVLEGYIGSFGLSEDEWTEESASGLCQDNDERERF